MNALLDGRRAHGLYSSQHNITVLIAPTPLAPYAFAPRRRVLGVTVHFGPGAAYRRRGATLYGLFDIGGARPVVLGCPSTHM